MDQINTLYPPQIWSYFSDICRIPRLSKHEEKIRIWLKEFAGRYNLEYREDNVGNIVIVREPSPGFGNRKTVILQSHLDMVGEKNSDHPHDWMKDPIIPVIKNGWVTAEVTTLGADDGIGIAAQMAILADPNIRAGKIECLFTIDEETGMTGAKNIDTSLVEGKTMINLDSEDEGILFIGCAGGIDTVGTITYTPEKIPEGMIAMRLSLTGLSGGHSGDEIHKGLANSIKQMARFLSYLSGKYSFLLAQFDGGNLRNGIPREAFAVIAVNPDDSDRIADEVADFFEIIRDEFGSLEPVIAFDSSQVNYNGTIMSRSDSDRLINMLDACPHGVIAWSKDMEDLVETSTNLAIVKFNQPGTIEIVTTQRSSVESGKLNASGMVKACMKLAGAEVVQSEGYPGWKPNIKSEILNITKKSYRKLFGKEAEVRAIHAGLECGLFYEKFPGIDMISFGPTIKGAHTPEERINIETTSMFWNLLLDVLENIPER
ncbi:MAG: aminoacyl-histidine dipeptidase [Bacteroidales bacterium]